jgi:hypothetical protein
MSNKQPTAVEWLVKQLEKHYVFQDIKNTTAFLQAKEMEKEQIMSAYNNCELYNPEQYYEQTYGGKK